MQYPTILVQYPGPRWQRALDLRQRAAQHLDLGIVGANPREQAPQPRHHLPGIGRDRETRRASAPASKCTSSAIDRGDRRGLAIPRDGISPRGSSVAWYNS